MNYELMLAELRGERELLDNAIGAIEALMYNGKPEARLAYSLQGHAFSAIGSPGEIGDFDVPIGPNPAKLHDLS